MDNQEVMTNSHAALYPASFDPPTNGHLWMIKQGHMLFDRLVICVASHPEKKCVFSAEERVTMLCEMLEQQGIEDVDVICSGATLTAHFAEHSGTNYILRGLRGVSDMDYEKQMQHVNNDINSDTQTVFLMPPSELERVSSSMVRGICKCHDWGPVVEKYVPSSVIPWLRKKYGSN